MTLTSRERPGRRVPGDRCRPRRMRAHAYLVGLCLAAVVKPEGALGRTLAGVSPPKSSHLVVEATGAHRWWRLGAGLLSWQWELDHPLVLGSAKDMGLDDRTPTGDASKPPQIYDIDGFDNPTRTVAALHARGLRVIC